MSKRFFYKVYTSGEVDFFDNEQEYVNEEYTCDDVGGLHPMDYWELVELLNEQQATINELKEELRLEQDFASRWQKESEMLAKENERLKQQLLYEGDDVCGICKHEYLVPTGDYFIAKCKKEHKECSKKDIKYCEDFELIQADFEDLIKRMDKELRE